jgi:Uma2 family endonuclease
MLVEATPWTMADLLDSLGGIPAERVLLKPTPGTATEKDALFWIEGPNKRLVELVNGTLVEKGMGAGESSVNVRLITRVNLFVEDHDLGITLGSDGTLRMGGGNMRLPDLSFIAWEDMPNEEMPEAKVWNVTPTLTVEVLSESNTRREIDQKLKEYFDKGCKLSWIVDPEDKTVRVHTSVEKFQLLGASNTLSGGDVLPGFKLKIADLFPPKRRKRKRS